MHSTHRVMEKGMSRMVPGMSEPTLIQSYVGKDEGNCFFVSTIYRRSSSMYGGMYYETLVWKVDAKTFERGDMIDIGELNSVRAPTYRAAALLLHAEVCARLSERRAEWIPEDFEHMS